MPVVEATPVVAAVSIAMSIVVCHAAVKRAQPASTKASHEACIGALDLLCLIVFVAAVSVAKAGSAVHSR